jgi:hypothetical protein
MFRPIRISRALSGVQVVRRILFAALATAGFAAPFLATSPSAFAAQLSPGQEVAGGGKAVLVPAQALPRQGAGAARAGVAAAASPIDGLAGILNEPRVGRYDAINPSSFAFRFSGEWSGNPAEWSVAVDALRSADLPLNDENNWEKNVATFNLARASGAAVSTFSASGIIPFASLPNGWRQGGIGRLRVVVVWRPDPSQRFTLAVRDTDA